MKSWQSSAHIPHSLWLSPAGSLHKPGWTSCSGLSLSPPLSSSPLCLSRPWHRSPQARGYDDGNAGDGETESSLGCSLGRRWSQARPPPLVAPVQLAVCSVPTAPEWALCLDSLTDLNLNTLRTLGISTPCIHHPQSTSTSSLSACLFCEAISACVSSSFPTWKSLSWLSPLFHCISLASLFSPPVPLQLCSLLFSHVSLSVSLPLSFWDSIRALEAGERKQGGVKTSMALFTKGPGIARR